jgi:hypothetical protein
MLLTNPERAVSCALKGKAGCFAVADFWKEIGSMSKTDALAQLEKFFYQGLEHKGVQLPAATRYSPQCWPLLALRSKRLNIALGNILLTNPERAVSCALFCKFIFTKPLIFESTFLMPLLFPYNDPHSSITTL